MISLTALTARFLKKRGASAPKRRTRTARVELQTLEGRALLSHAGAPFGLGGPAAYHMEWHHGREGRGHDHGGPGQHGQHGHQGGNSQAGPRGQTILWNTLSPNSAIAVSSQNNGAIPSQAADDFFFTAAQAKAFTVQAIKIDGLFTDPKAKITDVNVQLYQTFPFDSTTTAAGAPTVRANGPSDNQFALFDSKLGTLRFHQRNLGKFTVAETITPGSTTAEGAVGPGLTGNLRELTIQLKNPITLNPAASPGVGQLNHYWLAVTVDTSSGSYYWVGGKANPITTGDRQTWIHTNPFDPNWHRISDVINGNNTNKNGTLQPAFNESFQIIGRPVY